MKPDEKELLELLQNRTKEHRFPYVRDVVKDLGMNEKRAAYLLLKWCNKGWYEYGVSVLAGWLTDEGMRQ